MLISSIRSENSRTVEIHSQVNVIQVCFISINMLSVWKKESGTIPQLCENSRKFEEAKDSGT